MIWVSGSVSSQKNRLLNDCHWNLVVASFFAWKKCFRNFRDQTSSWVAELKNIDCVKEPLRKLRCEAENWGVL